jgi:hypothetical protein
VDSRWFPLSRQGAAMTSYTRKPIQAVAHCPICPWIKIYFQTSNPKGDLKITAARGSAEHILSTHKGLQP